MWVGLVGVFLLGVAAAVGAQYLGWIGGKGTLESMMESPQAGERRKALAIVLKLDADQALRQLLEMDPLQTENGEIGDGERFNLLGFLERNLNHANSEMMLSYLRRHQNHSNPFVRLRILELLMMKGDFSEANFLAEFDRTRRDSKLNSLQQQNVAFELLVPTDGKRTPWTTTFCKNALQLQDESVLRPCLQNVAQIPERSEIFKKLIATGSVPVVTQTMNEIYRSCPKERVELLKTYLQRVSKEPVLGSVIQKMVPKLPKQDLGLLPKALAVQKNKNISAIKVNSFCEPQSLQPLSPAHLQKLMKPKDSKTDSRR